MRLKCLLLHRLVACVESLGIDLLYTSSALGQDVLGFVPLYRREESAPEVYIITADKVFVTDVEQGGIWMQFLPPC